MEFLFDKLTEFYFNKSINKKTIFENTELLRNLIDMIFLISNKDQTDIIQFKVTEKIIVLLCNFLTFPDKSIQLECIKSLKIMTDNFLKIKEIKMYSNFFRNFQIHLIENDIYNILLQFDCGNDYKYFLFILTLISNLTNLASYSNINLSNNPNDFKDKISKDFKLPLEYLEDLLDIFEAILCEVKNRSLENFLLQMYNILINLLETSDIYKQKIFESNFLKRNISKEFFNKFLKCETRLKLYIFLRLLTEGIKFGNANDIIKMNFFEFCIGGLERNKNSNENLELIKILDQIFESCEFLKTFNKNNMNAFMKIFYDKGGKIYLDNMVNSSNHEIYGIVTKIMKEYEDFDY